MRKQAFFLLCLILLSVTVPVGAQTSLEPFESIQVFGPFKVILVNAQRSGMDIDYNGVDKEDIIAEVHHGQLEIRLRNRHFFGDWDSGKDWRTVDVTVYYHDQLTDIEAEAGARITSRGVIKTESLEVTSTMGANVDLELSAGEVKATSTMGSEMRLSGRAVSLDASSSMGAQLDAGFLVGKSVYVKSSMGANARVHAAEELEASAVFGGTINYTGPATRRHTNTTFGGSVSSD